MAWYDAAGQGWGAQATAPAPARPWYSFSAPASQGWGGSGLDNLSTNQQLLYASSPSLVNRQLGNWLAPNHLSPFHQYIEAQAPKMQEDWAIASASDPTLQYTDYQHQHYGDLLNGFGALSANQRGENTAAFGNQVAGRMVYR